MRVQLSGEPKLLIYPEGVAEQVFLAQVLSVPAIKQPWLTPAPVSIHCLVYYGGNGELCKCEIRPVKPE